MAYPAPQVLPTRDGLDLGDLGHYSIVGAKRINNSTYPEGMPGEALFEVTLERD